MTRRRITLALGTAAGGLLGAWLASASAAFADSLEVDPVSPSVYTVTPVDPETVTGLNNMTAAPPGIDGSLQGYQSFDITEGGKDLGTVYGYESTNPYLGPNFPGSIDAGLGPGPARVLYVDSDVEKLLGDSPGTGALPDGSVIATSSISGTAYENIYSAIPSTTPGDPATVTDYLVNTTTGHTMDLSGLINGLGFDATNTTPALPDYITGVGAPTVTGVNGYPPLTIAIQGYQPFEFDNNPADTFNGLETTTTDGFGFHTEALLVTGDTGTGTGAPPVGSVFNTIDFHNLQNVYSSIPQADGTDKVTDILTNTVTGHTTDLSSLFAGDDASAGLIDGSNVQPFFFGNGYTIAPVGPETFTGVNGLPPGNASIQGTEEFEVYHGSVPVGTFTADVTTIPHMALSNDAETLLVTSDTPGTDPVGTAPGDLPPVGSVFDIQGAGNGSENVYSDLSSPTGHDVISDWYATPLGNFNLSPFYQHLDSAAGLNPDAAHPLVSFMDTVWLDLFGHSGADAISNSAANSADALAASVDPSAAASLVDPLPHLEAALNLLAGLF